MTRPLTLTALAIASVLLVSACSSDPEAAPTSASPSTSAESSTPAVPPTAGAINEDTGEEVTTAPVPVWDDASRESAVSSAEEVVRAFAQPELDFEQWWAQVQPLLDQKASRDYSYMDPAVIPASEVTGEGKLLDEDSAYVARVEVPTDVGVYTVIMSRTDAVAPWLTSRITPPEGSS